MSDSTFGRLFRITTWGESHGAGIGVVIDGCPAGVALCEEDIQKLLDLRKPGQSRYTTARNESDSAFILSGVFEGRTTGTPISVMVRNADQKSRDYSNIAESYRPGHADYTYDQKYGFRDYRGGGRSSGRETIGRVIGGAVAMKVLEKFGVSIITFTSSIGPVRISEENMDFSLINDNALRMPQADISEAEVYLKEVMANGDSAGGVIECHISGCPAGLGSPVFGKIDAQLSKAVMSIGAVKGVEIGDGFEASTHRGSENNDSFYSDGTNTLKRTNHSGGILGGMSDGDTIILRAAIKPTPSISMVQDTVNRNNENIKLQIKGRHDPCIVPRAVPVVASMCAITILDALMVNATSEIHRLIAAYQKD